MFFLFDFIFDERIKIFDECTKYFDKPKKTLTKQRDEKSANTQIFSVINEYPAGF